MASFKFHVEGRLDYVSPTDHEKLMNEVVNAIGKALRSFEIEHRQPISIDLTDFQIDDDLICGGGLYGADDLESFRCS